MTTVRQYSIFDKICIRFDNTLKTGRVNPVVNERRYPAEDIAESNLSREEKRHCAGLMRVNHVGEVCAQALYKGQAMTARLEDVRGAMQQAALEEQDHLRWCKRRLDELGSHTSYLNPLWFFGAFSIGFIAGSIGDKWSLGFVAETEHQVVAHLESHLQKLPEQDQKSQAIVKQMAQDEAEHAEMAIAAGAAQLPDWVKKIMRLQAKIMTSVAYWL